RSVRSPWFLLPARAFWQYQPLGVGGIIGAWNYPLLLPGVQIAQALAAGNRVFFKPAPDCEAVSARLIEMFRSAGLPQAAIELLPSAPQSAIERIDQGVDLVVLTGAAQTGRAVLRQCADKLTPAIMELSGCDAVIVGRGANLTRVAKAVRFGLMFNGGATCIGPRRILVANECKSQLVDELRKEFKNTPPARLHSSAMAAVREAVEDALRRGAVHLLEQPKDASRSDDSMFSAVLLDNVSADWPIANSDLFAPVASVISFASDEQAIETVNRCRYRLAAAVFGPSDWAHRVANQLQVGTVTVQDILFPTADPRLSFGGRGESGFGVTRGAEGLLEMTVPRVIADHRGRVFLHLAARSPKDLSALASALTLTHATVGQKWAALRRLCTRVK
ncbi:MAG: aldehyde dehydrogenase family protein, partial [Planctomycetaceae bacterium]